MVVGIISLELYLPQVRSLKEKRSILKSLIQKIRNSFNVSISEVNYHDKWQRAGLGVGVVTTDQAQLDSISAKLEMFIEREIRVNITLWNMRLV